MKISFDSQAVNGESVNEVGERPTLLNKAASKRANKQDTDDRYKICVKRAKGVPKSPSKDIYYAKHCTNGAESTQLAKAIVRFEKKHRRAVCIDDVVRLFQDLNSDEPHASVLYYRRTGVIDYNYYQVLYSHECEYDEEPFDYHGITAYSHTNRMKYTVKTPDMTFEEIIREHFMLMSEMQHRDTIKRDRNVHSGLFKRVPRPKPPTTTIPSGDDLSEVDEDDYMKPDNDGIDVSGVKFSYDDIQPLLEKVKLLVPDCDKYVDIIEDLIYVSYIILYNEDPNILFGALIQIFKKHHKGSFTKSIYKFIQSICKKDNKPQIPQSGNYRKYINQILNYKNTILYSKIVDGLSMCIAFGFIDPINITVKNLKLFSVHAYQVGENCTDFITYLLELLLYFFDTGMHIFTGNFERLFDTTELGKIDENMVHLQTYINSVQIGTYKKETGKDIQEYHAMLMETIESLKLLSSTITDKTYRSLVLNKLSLAYKLLVNFDQSKPLSGLRQAPFSMCFFGQSSVGKSCVAKMIMTNVLNFNGKPCDDSHICTIQPTDKFYSTYKANVTGVIIDDLCNTKSEKAVVDPASLLISIINNIPYYAPKADTKEKGRIDVTPSVVAVTTNVKTLEAHIWSNEPISVVRRLKYHIEVFVKDQYCTNRGFDSSKVDDAQIANLREHGIQDCWWFTVRYVERYLQGTSEHWRFTTVTHNGKLLEKLDIYELIAFLNEQSAKHHSEQKNFVNLCKDAGLRNKNCNKCFYPCSRCICPPIVDEPDDKVQSYDTRVDGNVFGMIDSCCEHAGRKAATYILSTWNSAMPTYLEEKLFGPVLKVAFVNYLTNHWLNITNYVPYSLRETEAYRGFYMWCNRWKYYVAGFTVLGATSCVAVVEKCCRKNDYWYLHTAAVGGISAAVLFRYTYSNLMEDLRGAPLQTIIPPIQCNQTMRTVFKVGISVGVAIMAIRTFKSFYVTLRKCLVTASDDKPDEILQGNLNPVTYEDVVSRDEEVNCWAKTSEPFIRNVHTENMTTDQLINKISPNVMNMIMEFNEHSGTTIGCIALQSNIFACPLHFFKEEKDITGRWRKSNVRPYSSETSSLYKLRFVKHDGISGNYFTATLDYNDIVQVGDLDLCIFRIYSGGSFPNILKYCSFLETHAETKTLKRDPGGVLIHGFAQVKHCETSYVIPTGMFSRKVVPIQGGRAQYNTEPRCGDCMMVHIRNGTAPSIVGFHISGNDNSKQGSYIMWKLDQITLALEHLENKHKIFNPHSGGSFPMNMNRLGTMIKISEIIPSSAPVSYVDKHNYVIRGTIDVQSSYYTEIRPTFMCSKVEEIFGEDNIYAGPKFGPKRYLPFYTFLSASSGNPEIMNSSLLKLAMDDYVGPLIPLMTEYNKGENMRPLEHHEILNGIPGKRFIDHINFNSSIGYPLKGKKISHMSGEPTKYDFAEPELFQIEFEVMRERYLKGERYYPIFKASLKDEAVAKTKDKVRVFQAADITLQYGWRKYGLPILRFLSMFPLASECAVGINPYSDEWQQLHDFLTFNETNSERIVAGDYKLWDQKLPSQLVLAAFEMIVRIAEHIPTYTSDDILMIKGLATDTTYYLSHFNGTLIEFNSGLPSGHNLTAHVNSIANALLQRYAYYYYRNPAPFRTYCHNTTYGDDFVNGVSPKIKYFNHVLYKKVVESLGMTLTMPDKTSAPIPFLHMLDCDFLKRKSVKCDIDGKYYGALDVKSMMKSLFVRGKTSVSDREHGYSVIRGFVHDLSYHDRKTYETKILLVRELLDKISMIMPEALYDYDDYYEYRNRRKEWWQKEDALDSAIDLDDYPMTPEASSENESIDYYVSSSSSSSGDECEPDIGKPLAENKTNNSYLDTKVLNGREDRIPHDNVVQSEVFGASEDHLDNSVVATGTAVLTSSAEHSMQTLSLQRTDMLSLRQHESRDLQYYLSRPRRIGVIRPATDTSDVTTFPLLSFLSLSVIRDKIRYYAYLNAVLHIKVVVVGSPTMAGSQIIALHPWYARDNGLGPLNYGRTMPDLAQLSQLPSVITDLSREKGGEIALPIICPSNGLDITRTESIRDSFALHYKVITPTRLPTGSGIRPEITVYAWLTDVSLTGTTTATELPQSDEYCIDPHHRPSSDVPTIKDGIAAASGEMVGKATEMGVKALLGAMGLSNPNSQEGVGPIVPRVAGNLSCYNAPTNIDSLAGDYKNEVLLDTRHLGYEDPDHMNLNNILSRWTIVSTFNLTTGQTTGPLECYTFPVTPMACFVANEGTSTVFTPTALGMAALPFNRWRGTITYRFQAVGTAFMKGKIKISHDVRSPSVVNESTKVDTQVLNSVIWDLATSNVIEIKVPWASNQVFKTCGLLRNAITSVGPDGSNLADVDANGSLIFNQFTLLNDNDENAISFIVYIKGEPGMVFGDMRAVLANYTFAGIDPDYTGTPQSAIYFDYDLENIDFENSTEYILRFLDGSFILIDPSIWRVVIMQYRNKIRNDTPQSMVYSNDLNTSILTGDKPGAIMAVNITGLEENITDHDEFAMLCMGEKWYSIRQIIKRYTHNWTRNIRNTGNVNSFYRIRLPDRPVLKGWQGQASLNVQPGVNGIPVTFARDSFLSFYSVAFLGYRGSLRHKLHVSSTHSATSACEQHAFSVSRTTSGYVEERRPIGGTSDTTSVSDIARSASAIPTMPDARAGMALGHSRVNPILEYSTPYSSRGKFCWAQDRYPQILKDSPDGGYDVPWHQIIVHQFNGGASFQTRVDKYIAAGDDFSLFFYLYGPRMTLLQPNSYPQ